MGKKYKIEYKELSKSIGGVVCFYPTCEDITDKINIFPNNGTTGLKTIRNIWVRGDTMYKSIKHQC